MQRKSMHANSRWRDVDIDNDNASVGVAMLVIVVWCGVVWCGACMMIVGEVLVSVT